jgi:hypothetical protein
VEFDGSIDGWSISRTEGGPSPDSFGGGDSVQITMKRALGPLTFDIGICLVLTSLPALAIFTTFRAVTGRMDRPSAGVVGALVSSMVVYVGFWYRRIP